MRRDRVLRLTIAAAVGALLFVSASLTLEIFCLKDVVGARDTAYALLVCASMAAMVWEPPLCPAQLAAAAALALEASA